GRRGAVFTLAAGRGTGRRHKERVNQPNNHSKLTDSNNCTVFSSYFEFCCSYCDIPPPCVFCWSPSSSVVVRRQGSHVKRVPEVGASLLRDKNFLPDVVRSGGDALA